MPDFSAIFSARLDNVKDDSFFAGGSCAVSASWTFGFCAVMHELIFPSMVSSEVTAEKKNSFLKDVGVSGF